MRTESPDILHGIIHVAYKCFTCENIAKMP